MCRVSEEIEQGAGEKRKLLVHVANTCVVIVYFIYLFPNEAVLQKKKKPPGYIV